MKTKKNINYENLLNTLINAEKEIISLKHDLNDIKCEEKVYKIDLGSIKNTHDRSRKESLSISTKLMRLSDETIVEQNELHVFKKEERIFKNYILLVNNECNMLKSTIRKEVGLVKTIRNKVYNTRKDIDAFKINSQNCKKKRVNVTAKKNVMSRILELNGVININKNKITNYTARNERVKREIERNNNEIRMCIARNEKCMDDLNKLVNLSNAEKTSANNDNTKVQLNNDNSEVQLNEDNSNLKVNNTKVQAHNDKVKVGKVQAHNDKVKVDKVQVNNTKVQVNNDKVRVNKDNTKLEADKNKAQVNNDKSIMIKKKVVDQVNLIAKIRTDYLKNNNEISEIMTDLHDDPQLRHIELNKINVLTDKSLDHASEFSHGENREWYGVLNNIDTIND